MRYWNRVKESRQLETPERVFGWSSLSPVYMSSPLLYTKPLNVQLWDVMSEYREIINFEGYVVSDDGEVRSLDRFICHPRSENKKQFVKGRELKKQHDKDGYEAVGLHKNGKLYIG